MEQYGDSDPGISADGQTIFSSRGLSPLPADPAQTLRHLYASSSDAYTPGKVRVGSVGVREIQAGSIVSAESDLMTIG